MTTTPTENTWEPPVEGYTTTPNCPTCGHSITVGALPVGEQIHEIGPCIECGDELSVRNDVMGLMVMGKAWRTMCDAAIAAELAARRKCPKCKRLRRVTTEGKIVLHTDRGERCDGSGADPVAEAPKSCSG
jgi:hypothetical protein